MLVLCCYHHYLAQDAALGNNFPAKMVNDQQPLVLVTYVMGWGLGN
jgi:hypothetical protein